MSLLTVLCLILLGSLGEINPKKVKSAKWLYNQQERRREIDSGKYFVWITQLRVFLQIRSTDEKDGNLR